MVERGGVVALATAYDSKGKRDATRAFLPEAKAFTGYWADEGYPTHLARIDTRARMHVRRRQVAEALGLLSGGIKHVAIFAHGWRTGIQLGFHLRHVGALARLIDVHAVDEAPVVSVYCCSTAQGGPGGDGGFADELRDAMCSHGLVQCRVDAHTTRGHTTRNPHLRRFEGEGSTHGGQGGRFIVRPRGKLWGAWKRALRDREDPLRYAFGRMDVAEIHDWLWPVS